MVTDTNLGTLRESLNADGDVELILDATVDFGGSAGGGNLIVQDLTGRTVYSTAIPPANDTLKIRWDGRDAEGNLMPPGSYRVSAEALINGQSQSVSVYAHQQVQSVAIDGRSGQVSLELGNGQDLSIDQVKAFL